MRITVCQLPDDPQQLQQDWLALCDHSKSANSDFVLLPEMPFYPWMAASRTVNDTLWEEAVQKHYVWRGRLSELAASCVAGTQPNLVDGGKRNAAFVYQHEQFTLIRDKYYLPDDPGFWEATWYERGEKSFKAVNCGDLRVGFMICTELWFTEHARAYGKQGVHLILNPRATEKASVEKWLVGGRAAAIMSGAYCASSNHYGASGSVEFGGAGWVIDPDGEILAVTSEQTPFITVDIDLSCAEAAKATYPRYVLE